MFETVWQINVVSKLLGRVRTPDLVGDQSTPLPDEIPLTPWADLDPETSSESASEESGEEEAAPQEMAQEISSSSDSQNDEQEAYGEKHLECSQVVKAR